MIVIDLSQTLYASILAYDVKHPDKIDINIFRHICLTAIYNILMKFKYSEYGPDVVIACDMKSNWRKELFSYYKYNRKKSRSDSDIDWEVVFKNFETIKEELKEYFTQYKVIEVERAEADDVIYVTTKYCYERNIPLMIISSDKDLVQLHRYPNVKQFDSIRKVYKEIDDPVKFLDYQIFKGDNSDGVPNVLSPENSYYIGQRCKPLYESKIEKWLEDPMFKFNPEGVLGEEVYKRYEKNKKLIDLTCLPKDIYDNIYKELEKDFDTRDSNKLLNYFCDKKLTNLMQHIQDF